MSVNIYDKGDLVRLTGTFTDSSGTAQDPDEVFLSFLDPSGNQTDIVYSGSTLIVKSATGIYYYDLDCDEHGRWAYRWYATGNGQCATARELEVRQSQFSTGGST